MRGIRLKMVNSFYSRMLHLQVTCEIHNRRQEVCCASLDPTRLFQSRGCATSKPQLLTAVQILKLSRWTQVYVRMVDNCVFESIDHVQPNNPNRSLSTKLYSFVDNAAVQMINKGRSPNLRHVTKTLSVDLDWLFGRVNLDHSILIKYARTNDQLVDISRKGMFATMQRHLSLHL